MKRFFLVSTLGLLAAYSYLVLRIGSGPVIVTALTAMTVGLWLFPLSLRSAEARSTRLAAVLRGVSFFSMGFLSFVFSLTALRDLIFLPARWFGGEWAAGLFSPLGDQGVMAAALLALAFGVWNAVSGPRVREVTVRVEGLPGDFEELRIVQISDLHVGATIGKRYVERAVRMANGLGAHLVALTGDITDGPVHAHLADAGPMRELAPRGRVYFVPGNHEYYWDFDRWQREIRGLGLIPLLNANETIRHGRHQVTVAGVTDPAASYTGIGTMPDPRRAIEGGESSPLKVLLAHHPKIAPEAAAAGFDLQLSGHTHGGQFFPWTLVVRRVHRFALGLLRCGGMWVYVSPGTGSWGPPIRLGTTPEVTLLRLRPG